MIQTTSNDRSRLYVNQPLGGDSNLLVYLFLSSHSVYLYIRATIQRQDLVLHVRLSYVSLHVLAKLVYVHVARTKCLSISCESEAGPPIVPP